MGYGLMVFAMNTDKLAAIYGCQEEEKIELLQDSGAWEIENIDELFEDSIEDGAPSTLAAWKQIIRGENLDRNYGSIYAYAIEIYCQVSKQKFLNNAPFSPCNLAWLEEVDSMLEKLGIVAEFRLEKFIYGSLPISIPSPDDFPCCGHIKSDIVYRAFQDFKKLDSIDVADRYVEAIEAIQEWLNYAGKRFERGNPLGLVGFYH